MTKMEQIKQRKIRNFGQFDESKLSKKFIPHFESGKRIKIESFGAIKFGTVGITTGWQPVFLLMERCNQIGSSETLSDETKILGVKVGNKYV